MDVSGWVWAATSLFVVGLIAFDFFAHVRTPHAPTFSESVKWSVFYIALALAFGVLVGMVWGWDFGTEYFAGYVTEKSLSVDNVFVFLIIMTKFAVPREYQQKVLLFGVAIALVLRTIFILLGAAAIEQFSWVFYIFGAFLVYTAVKLATEKHDSEHQPKDEPDGFAVRTLKRVLPTTDEYHGDRLSVRIDGKRLFTPMLVVMVAIGSTDLLFALDSIPATFGVTQVTFLVFAANAFALLGLRALFFVLRGLLDRLIYLSVGLSVILAFIGTKLILTYAHEVNADIPKIETFVSLGVILVILTVTTIASLLKANADPTAHGHSGSLRGHPPNHDDAADG